MEVNQIDVPAPAVVRDLEQIDNSEGTRSVLIPA